MKKLKLLDYNFTNGQALALNMFSSIFNLMITLGISFFVSPYIVKMLGAEANGFTTLANNFISYATILKVAMNSMGSRFVTISYIQGEKKKAQKYYSALFFGDLILSIFFGLVAFVLVWRLEYIINISTELITDVKILFGLVFFNFIFNTITSVWLTATFITNKIYLDKIREIQGIFVRLLVTVIGLSFFEPKIYYVALGTMLGAFVTNAYSFYYKCVLIPDIKAKKKDFSWKYTKEILASGVWNSISNMGDLLFSGLDLLITNLFIGGAEMGILAIAKTLPNMASSLNGTLQGVFTPKLVGDYAREGKESVAKTLVKSSRIIMMICIIPLCFLIVYGDSFYALWQPTENAKQLQILSVLTCASSAITACAMSFYNIFTVVNKVKQSSIATLITGAISAIVTYCLVSRTDLGIYAVAGVSSVMYSMRSLCFAIPMVAKYLKLKWTTFYPLVGLNVIAVFSECLVGMALRSIIPCDSWLGMIVSGMVFGVLALAINIVVLLEKEQKKVFLTKLRMKLMG